MGLVRIWQVTRSEGKRRRCSSGGCWRWFLDGRASQKWWSLGCFPFSTNNFLFWWCSSFSFLRRTSTGSFWHKSRSVLDERRIQDLRKRCLSNRHLVRWSWERPLSSLANLGLHFANFSSHKKLQGMSEFLRCTMIRSFQVNRFVQFRRQDGKTQWVGGNSSHWS